MSLELNSRAHQLADTIAAAAAELRVRVEKSSHGARLIDCGIDVEGGLCSGLLLARVCMADLGQVSMVPGTLGAVPWPTVQVMTDHPLAACMAAQYAGWQIALGNYFAMGSGPMRAAAGREELFDKIGFRESPEVAVGVLETRKLPNDDVLGVICAQTGVPASRLTLLAAPTASIAGGIQVVARSVETALHKLHELDFEIARIVSAHGTAPLPPVAADDLSAIGRTNDAVLYGAQVTLWYRGDDEAIHQIGAKVPACASSDYGAPFAEIFDRAGRDFYKIDPELFSPAEVAFQNLDSGKTARFGRTDHGVLRQSFGL